MDEAAHPRPGGRRDLRSRRASEGPVIVRRASVGEKYLATSVRREPSWSVGRQVVDQTRRRPFLRTDHQPLGPPRIGERRVISDHRETPPPLWCTPAHRLGRRSELDLPQKSANSAVTSQQPAECLLLCYLLCSRPLEPVSKPQDIQFHFSWPQPAGLFKGKKMGVVWFCSGYMVLVRFSCYLSVYGYLLRFRGGAISPYPLQKVAEGGRKGGGGLAVGRKLRDSDLGPTLVVRVRGEASRCWSDLGVATPSSRSELANVFARRSSRETLGLRRRARNRASSRGEMPSFVVQVIRASSSGVGFGIVVGRE
ncbi:uncharacterized protein A4U43_C06F9430 [Asparagus officinalis]|uniref:Uncharacterized protein n=1 Tax=Asparagus officinalis TaxID=4686 RepID=A0A5P1EN30_ASPOF|nr:uncharacterized protein A4U43_C06F9430 [Asparagus officinalis]